MADFCPSSKASSDKSSNADYASECTTEAPINGKQPGQLWKKIGIVGSVAVMGGQPVLAQIDISPGETTPSIATTEAEPFLTVAPESAEVSVLVTPPIVVAPEAAEPTFSSADEEIIAPEAAETAFSSADEEIVAPEVAEPALSSTAEAPIAAQKIEAITPQIEITINAPDTAPEVEASTAETTSSQPIEAITSQVEITINAPEAAAPIAETDAAAPKVDIVAPEPDSVSVDGAAPEAAAPEGELATPSVDIVKPSDVVPDAIPTVEGLAAEYGGVFVDPTEYSEGETVNPNAPEVFVSERSTGCEYKVDTENVDGCGAPEKESATIADAPRAILPTPSINVGPVSISRSGVRFSGGSTTVAGREFYNTVAKPLVELQAGESFVFPLASPSPITSLFGWRWHPIHNDYRFHNGTDLGAPQGTPIMATQSGQVSLADYLGGYGLTVILRHSNNTLESRYAHMSHILVQPGEWVEQGDVIGLVGSTGNSTGPHLHFELHQLTSQGWAAINPDDVLRYALANLNNRLNGSPLQAFNFIPTAQASTGKAALPKAVKSETLVKDTPHFRPAQPNAQ